MSAAQNILLIGARGSGKTTLGRQLARRLDRPFIDLDDVTLERLGAASVAEVWSAQGEGAWREAEAATLVDLLRDGGQVVALGGGTPMVPSARRAIERAREDGRGHVVYLACPAAELARRLRGDPGDRPSLTGRDPAAEITQVLAERESTYRALADLVVDTATVPIETLLERLATGPGTG